MSGRVISVCCVLGLAGAWLGAQAQDRGIVGGPTAIELGGACLQDGNCLPRNSKCLSGTCQCPDGFWELNSTTCGKKLGDPCRTDSNCTDIEGAKCDRVCTCDVSAVPTTDKTKCLNISTHFGSPCENGIQCTSKWGDGAQCAPNRTCACNTANIFNGTWCPFIIDLVNERCDPDSQICYLAGDGALDHQSVSCVNNVCLCNKGHTASADRKKCNSAATLHLSFSSFVFILLAKMMS